MRISRYILVFIVGFFIAKFWYQKEDNHQTNEEIEVVVNSIKNMSKLVVSSGNFSEVYNFSDSKKYFYDYVSFDKQAPLHSTVRSSKVFLKFNIGFLRTSDRWISHRLRALPVFTLRGSRINSKHCTGLPNSWNWKEEYTL